MTDPMNGYAIKVEGISKRYDLGTMRGAGRLKDRLAGLARIDRQPRPREVELWALRDVSFNVPHGKVLGVIGRIGSGKTTLMRILARVTAPSEGRATIDGKVGAIFQVGTGFHQELTGRENVLLGAALLGMDPAEARATYDSIVEFAELGDFIEVPVKYYSSGMYLRLAFSVTSMLATDVLLIDEALGTGDTNFQAKSKQRIAEMVRSGRTVVLVSHAADSIRTYCDSAIVLEHGSKVYEGGVDDALSFYGELLSSTPTSFQTAAQRSGKR